VGLLQIIHFIRSCLLSLRLPCIGTINPDVDGSGAYDFHCDVLPPFFQTIYHPTMEANISVNLANYGGATDLNLLVFAHCFRATLFITSCSTWTYWPTYFGLSVPPGSSIPFHSQVGDVGFDDSFPAVAFGPGDFFPEGTAWNNGMYALGSKTMSLRYFISSQILSQ
jgi:hypothetical protein